MNKIIAISIMEPIIEDVEDVADVADVEDDVSTKNNVEQNKCNGLKDNFYKYMEVYTQSCALLILIVLLISISITHEDS